MSDAPKLSPTSDLRPCTRLAWCVLHEGHPGVCLEIPRAKHEPADYGPKRKR